MTEPLTISVEDAAKLLGISRGLAYEAARRGELPVIRLGRRLLVPRQRLFELVGADTDFGGNGGVPHNPKEVTSQDAVGGLAENSGAGIPPGPVT